nr:transposase [[Leptolyngbya] sp. PCC 7376]
MTSLEPLFCSIDDFCQVFEPQWQQQLLVSKQRQRRRPRSLSLSEIMTILIAFDQSHYRHFKYFYLINVRHHWRRAFPRAVSYQRFVEWMPSTLVPLCIYLRHCYGQCTGISFIDATSIKVCHNRCIVKVTPGNTDDRKPVVELLKELSGKVFADKGYVSQPLAQYLQEEYDVRLL